MNYIILNNSPKYGGGVEQVTNNLIRNFSAPFKKSLILVCNDLKEKDEFYFNEIKCFNLKTKKYSILDKIYRTDYNFRGVIVPAKKHKVEFYSSLF